MAGYATPRCSFSSSLKTAIRRHCRQISFWKAVLLQMKFTSVMEIYWSKCRAVVNRLYCPIVPLLTRKDPFQWRWNGRSSTSPSQVAFPPNTSLCGETTQAAVHMPSICYGHLTFSQKPKPLPISFCSCIICSLWLLRVFIFTVCFLYSHLLIHCCVLSH